MFRTGSGSEVVLCTRHMCVMCGFLLGDLGDYFLRSHFGRLRNLSSKFG